MVTQRSQLCSWRFGGSICVMVLLLLVLSACVPVTPIPPSTATEGEAQIDGVPAAEISAEFTFESKFVDVLGSQMHYIDEGEGDPILFLHGNPTSSYLWRNVIPYLQPHGRVIAVDNIGFGKSDKPDIDYTYADHIQYIEGFIDALALKNITLVIHDWGSALGFDYASRHADNVKGIAFMEALIPPGAPIESYEAMGPEFGELFRAMRDPQMGPAMIIDQNMFIEVILPASIVRDLTPAEMDAYREPFLDPASRKPVLVWPNEVPIGGEPENTVQLVNAYGAWLMETDLPKLHIYASPGALNPPELVAFLAQNLKNYESAYIGAGLHFIQEDNPEAIGRAIADWYRRLADIAGGQSTASAAMAPGFAPVPAPAFGPAIDQEKGYLVEKISDGLYWVTEGSYQMMFLVTGEGVIVVDAPPTIGQNILNAIAEVTDEPITHVVYSHTHADHIGAAGLYPEDAIYIAHEETAAQLERTLAPEKEMPYGVFAGGGPVPVPTMTFNDDYRLAVGNQVLELSYKGANHEPGNIFIYAPEQKVLMLVDVIFPGWTPFSKLALAEDIPGYYAAHDQVLAYDFETFIGGHLTRLGTREDVEIQQAYILEIQANAAAALQQVDFMAIAQETGFENQWLLFDRYLDTVAQTCANATVPQWLDRLGAVDVWTVDHCWIVMESLRID